MKQLQWRRLQLQRGDVAAAPSPWWIRGVRTDSNRSVEYRPMKRKELESPNSETDLCLLPPKFCWLQPKFCPGGRLLQRVRQPVAVSSRSEPTEPTIQFVPIGIGKIPTMHVRDSNQPECSTSQTLQHLQIGLQQWMAAWKFVEPVKYSLWTCSSSCCCTQVSV